MYFFLEVWEGCRVCASPTSHKDDLALCCWQGCQKVCNGVIMAADKTGIPNSASGHHDDSSLCSTLRWRRLRDDGCSAFGCLSDWRDTPQPVDAGDRHYSPLFSIFAPHSSRRLPPSRLPACSAATMLQNKRQMQISICFHGYQGGCCKDCCKAFWLTPLCLETMLLRPTPPSVPSHYTLLDSLGSADRCSLKHALIHKTYPVFTCWGCYDLMQCEFKTSKFVFGGNK